MPWLNYSDDSGKCFVKLHPFAEKFLESRGWNNLDSLADALGVEASTLAYLFDIERDDDDGLRLDDFEILRAIGFTLDDIIALSQPHKPVLKPVLKLVKTGKRR